MYANMHCGEIFMFMQRGLLGVVGVTPLKLLLAPGSDLQAIDTLNAWHICHIWSSSSFYF